MQAFVTMKWAKWKKTVLHRNTIADPVGPNDRVSRWWDFKACQKTRSRNSLHFRNEKKSVCLEKVLLFPQISVEFKVYLSPDVSLNGLSLYFCLFLHWEESEREKRREWNILVTVTKQHDNASSWQLILEGVKVECRPRPTVAVIITQRERENHSVE